MSPDLLEDHGVTLHSKIADHGKGDLYYYSLTLLRRRYGHGRDVMDRWAGAGAGEALRACCGDFLVETRLRCAIVNTSTPECQSLNADFPDLSVTPSDSVMPSTIST